MGLVSLDPQNKFQLTEVSRLQALTLPESLPALLGPDFMKRFYFSKLVEAGLVNCDLYLVGNKVAGYSLFTHAPNTFLTEAKTKYLASLVVALIISFLKNPYRLVYALRASKRDSDIPKLEEEFGQWLSFGVEQEFLSHKNENGKRIAEVFLESMKAQLAERRITRVLGEVSKSNKLARFFYSSAGFKVYKDPLLNEETLRIDLNYKADSQVANQV